jgi:hypothetical protein
MTSSGRRRGIAGMARALGFGDAGSVRRGSNVVDVGVNGGDVGEHTASAFTVFAAMPFDPSFEDVYFVAIRGAVEAAGGTAVRVDQTMHAGDAVAATQHHIRICTAVIADLSTGEPDVLYELGLAHALGKPSIQICGTAHQDLPFMVRNRETLLYEAGRTHLLRQQLVVYLRGVLRQSGRSSSADRKASVVDVSGN